MGKVSRWVKDNKKFLIKSGVLAGLSVTDAVYTNMGISNESLGEGGPVIESYLALYGYAGPYLMKAAATTVGMLGMWAGENFPEKTSAVKGDYIFYIGTAAYAAASIKAICRISTWPF